VGIQIIDNYRVDRSVKTIIWDRFIAKREHVSPSGTTVAFIVNRCEQEGLLYTISKKRAFDYVYYLIELEKKDE